jgi:glycosyltransferase involved in cell wall biosynthesis
MAVFDTDFSFIKRAIDSVLHQDYQNFELIIIDDGSLNDSQTKILDYVVKNEEKIIYLRHKNCGQAESINRGVLISSGDYITIIDADDQYKTNHLSSCLNAIQGMDLIASKTETIASDSSDFYVPNKYNLSELIHVDDCILFATLFGKKEVFSTIKFEKLYSRGFPFF